MNWIGPALSFFLGDPDRYHVTPLGKGNINDTFLVESSDPDARYVLQRLNTDVFQQPEEVLVNMEIVTSHVRRCLEKNRIAPEIFTCPELRTGRDGTSRFFRTPDGSFWRLLSYVSGSRTLQAVQNETQAFELGDKLGLFHRFCRSLVGSRLTDTLPGFHITPGYLNQFDLSLNRLSSSPDEKLQACLNCVASFRNLAMLLEQDRRHLRAQIIHGDPKVSNFLFDQSGERVISLIDLDTVKPGLLLHDIGDALRSCCNPLGENLRTPDQARFHRIFFNAWLKGYLAQADFLLTKQDKERIVAATQLITFELGLRFLTDFLNGSHYFKIDYPDHNLHRALVQFALVRSMESMRPQLEEDLHEIIGSGSPSGRSRQ